MTVRVLAWNHLEALAIVDGTRVRIRRIPGRRARWICQWCGRGSESHCVHTRALASTTPPPDRYRIRKDPRP